MAGGGDVSGFRVTLLAWHTRRRQSRPHEKHEPRVHRIPSDGSIFLGKTRSDGWVSGTRTGMWGRGVAVPAEDAAPGGGSGGKWAATAASVWIQCTSGSSYCFGIYSPLLKSSQGYDQSSLDSVAFFKDVGANVGVLSGLLYSSASSPRRGGGWGCGPWVVHAAGAAQCFVGYFLMWLAVTGLVPRPPVPFMCLYMFLAAHAQTFFNTGNVVTAVQNFPRNRGTVVGVMKGFLGLSGAILIQIYRTMYEGKPSNFLLMIALLPTALPLVLMFLVRVYAATRRDDKQLLDSFSIISVIVAGYLIVIIIWENILPLVFAARVFVFVILLLLLTSPLAVVIRGKLKDSMLSLETSCEERISLMDDTEASGKGKCDEGAETEKAHLKHNHVAYRPSEVAPGPSSHGQTLPSRGENHNLLHAMGALDFWLLFLAMACGMGSGLATVNNISQVGGSIGYTSVETSTLVSLWSIWNFLGRFGAGYVSDLFQQSRGYARPLFIAITLGTMSIGHAMIASGLPGSLYVGSVVVGVCYGCQWSLMPTITSEIFGIMHMGTIFNTVAIASPIGSYILSVRVVGYIYDLEASGKKTCIGTHCFMLSFLIMACVTIFGSIASLALFFRTRRFYEEVVFESLQQGAAP